MIVLCISAYIRLVLHFMTSKKQCYTIIYRVPSIKAKKHKGNKESVNLRGLLEILVDRNDPFFPLVPIRYDKISTQYSPVVFLNILKASWVAGAMYVCQN